MGGAEINATKKLLRMALREIEEAKKRGEFR
jgi:hypothetical protein